MNTQTRDQALDQLEQSIADRIALYAGEYHAFLGWEVVTVEGEPFLIPRQGTFPRFHDAYDAIVGQIREGESGPDPIPRHRLVWDPVVSENFPVIAGTKITTDLIVSLINVGFSAKNIESRLPGVTEDDIRHCIAFSQSEMNP